MKFTLRLLRVVLSVFGFGFFIYALANIDLASLGSALSLSPVLAIPYALAFMLTALGFAFLTNKSQQTKHSFSWYLSIYAESWMARYAPGPSAITSKLAQLGERGMRLSLSAKAVSLDSIFLMLFTLLWGMVLSADFLFREYFSTEINLGWLLQFSIIAIFLAALWLAVKFGGARATFFYAASRLILTIGVYLSFLSLFPAINHFQAVGIYLFSILAGYASLVVPGGIGVRESVFIAMYLSVDGTFTEATTLAATARLHTLVADAMIGLGLLISKMRNHRKGQGAT